ncbi:MEIOTIC F-BOX protein MOF-like [Aegilops tauschii subsp. strangulata]|uniref:MEIOTIC F-BOX protein MOF-like n=1 Tax=Aegilops tauschii subsp. strangulata TaxID=200361 RepID=UPI003CC8D76B
MLGAAEPKRPCHADDGGAGDAGDDRLSALPDDLLRAILSRLKARQTVQTCALAARWRHLWRAVPCLDINERDFTTNLLRGHEFTLLEDFRLHGATVTIGDHWLRHEIGRDAWPRGLRRLRLSNVELQLADLASHISSSRCPALEEARLEKCWFLLTSNIKIASSSLKKLVVHGEYIMDEFEVFKLVIDAPALVSLRLGEELHHIVDPTEPHTVPSLVDASFHLRWIQEDLLFNEGHENLPLLKFKNLRTLFLGVCRISDDFLGLQQYLWNSPNLQRLTMRHCKVLDFQPTKEVMERHQSYSKDLEHFKCKKLRLCDSDPSVHLLVKLHV